MPFVGHCVVNRETFSSMFQNRQPPQNVGVRRPSSSSENFHNKLMSEHMELKHYPQDKCNATVYDAAWMRKFLATIETHPELFREVIGPLWDARIEAQEEIEGVREECLALFSALIGPPAPA